MVNRITNSQFHTNDRKIRVVQITETLKIRRLQSNESNGRRNNKEASHSLIMKDHLN